MKAPKKAPRPYWGRLHVEGTNETVAKLTCWAIPDHWNPEAKRWKLAEARGNIVRTRSTMARLFRRWRRETGQHGGYSNCLSRIMHWFVLEGLAGRIQVPNAGEKGNA